MRGFEDVMAGTYNQRSDGTEVGDGLLAFVRERPQTSRTMPRLKAPQRREQLIEVATRLFADFGYEATTTAAIARAAGVTEPILYRHFKSKQDLFVAIVRAVSKRTVQSWEALSQRTSDPAERIRIVAQSIPRHVRDLSDQYHVLHGALATSRDKKVLAVIREHYAAMEKFFCSVVRDGQSSGIFRSDLNPKSAAWQLLYSGIGFAMIVLNLGGGERGTIEDVIESILRGLKC
jgi:AcrR family transcriptional regulator